MSYNTFIRHFLEFFLLLVTEADFPVPEAKIHEGRRASLMLQSWSGSELFKSAVLGLYERWGSNMWANMKLIHLLFLHQKLLCEQTCCDLHFCSVTHIKKQNWERWVKRPTRSKFVEFHLRHLNRNESGSFNQSELSFMSSFCFFFIHIHKVFKCVHTSFKTKHN